MGHGGIWGGQEWTTNSIGQGNYSYRLACVEHRTDTDEHEGRTGYDWIWIQYRNTKLPASGIAQNPVCHEFGQCPSISSLPHVSLQVRSFVVVKAWSGSGLSNVEWLNHRNQVNSVENHRTKINNINHNKRNVDQNQLVSCARYPELPSNIKEKEKSLTNATLFRFERINGTERCFRNFFCRNFVFVFSWGLGEDSIFYLLLWFAAH